MEIASVKELFASIIRLRSRTTTLLSLEEKMKKKALILLILFALLLSACSARTSGNPTAQPPGQPAMDFGKGVEESGERELAPMAPEPAADGATGGGNAQTVERLVIQNASLIIVVVDPAASLETVSRMAEEMGGYVVTSNLYKTRLENGKEVPEATISVRVPSERLNDALSRIKALVRDPLQDVLSENVTGQDVTQAYTDLKSRLRNLEEAEAQLREIMASANKTEDVLNVFNQLTYIREQIELIKGQIQYYEESADLSAISVTIRAEEAVQPLTIGRWQPVGVARDAVQALINVMQFLVDALIWVLIVGIPVGIVLFLVARLVAWVLRKLRGQRQPKTVSPPTASAPPSA